MIDIDYQGIYDIITDTLPDDWDRVVLHCLTWSGSKEVKYFVKNIDGSFSDCYSLGVPDEIISNICIKLISLFKSEKQKWRTITLIIDSDGSFNAYADYSNDIKDYSDYMKNWRTKYLK